MMNEKFKLFETIRIPSMEEFGTIVDISVDSEGSTYYVVESRTENMSGSGPRYPVYFLRENELTKE